MIPEGKTCPTVNIIRADAARLPLADESVDLVLGSPPYCDARTYGIGAQRDCRTWIDWMLSVTREALRVSRGAVLWVVAGVTRARTYQPGPEGLLYEWWKAGGSCYRPVIWCKNSGVPGSGGRDWYRADTEYVLCFKRPGPLRWSQPTANGHPPKWAPGGAMSYRLTDGTRRNQWRGGEKSTGGCRRGDGTIKKAAGPKPSHRFQTKRDAQGGMSKQTYHPPVLANPGNVVRFAVGGGLLGHPLAHRNEAPFPVQLAHWFIRAHCPPGGIVLDPFAGSGTTGQAALELGRSAIVCDIRESQCDLMRRRLAGVQPELFNRDPNPPSDGPAGQPGAAPVMVPAGAWPLDAGHGDG